MLSIDSNVSSSCFCNGACDGIVFVPGDMGSESDTAHIYFGVSIS